VEEHAVSTQALKYDITKDDLSDFASNGPAFTFGQTMIQDIPADMQRLERARQVHISLVSRLALEFSRKVKQETLLMGSRPIVLAISGRTTPNAVGLLPFSEKSHCEKEVMLDL